MSREFSLDRLEGLYADRLAVKTFWRHDVDYSLEAALAMATFEQSIGISATYYLMVDSPFYPASSAFITSQWLRALGHSVGYHVDPRKVPPSSFAAMPVDMKVSFHCPRPSELWTRFPGVESAYDPIWEDFYYADSRGQFAHGDPEDHAPNTTIQVNLHAEWWFVPDWYEDVDDDQYEAFFHEPKSALWTT